jgi:hypothetical protein
MTGVPFAADPQSGWLNLPAMALYASLPCRVAVRWFVAFQPPAGGMGLYAFLRAEGLSRPAATVGGVGLSLVVAGSDVALNLPFSATLAWTAVLLFAAARFLKAQRWSGRLLWLVGVALAWGQVAAALLTNGVALSTGALVAYLAVRLWVDVRRDQRPRRQAVALGGLVVLALPAVNLAYLWPRLAYLPRTSIGLGYGSIDALSRRLAGAGSGLRVFAGGYAPTWPLRLALAPGVYLGAATLVLAMGAWGNRKGRALVMAFAGFGLACYLLTLSSVADALRGPLGATAAGQAYLHDPRRFAYGLLLALPVLAAAGTDALVCSRSLRDRALVLAPGAVLWAALPSLFGFAASRLRLLGVGLLVGAFVVWAVVRRPGLALLIPVALAAELVTQGVLAQARNAPPPPGQSVLSPYAPTGRPPVQLSRYARPGPIARTLQAHPGSRFISLDPAHWNLYGYQLHQEPAAWGLMATQRSVLFGLEEAQGYNSVQPLRYWEYVRAVAAKRIKYSVSYFAAAPRPVIDLLQVGWIVGPRGSPPRGVHPVPKALEGRWALYRVVRPAPRATVVTTWRTVEDAASSLRVVTAHGFDPEAEAVLEQGPGPAHVPVSSAAPYGASEAAYRSLGPQAARIVVRTRAQAIVLIRNSYDGMWHATVDGGPAPLLPADFVLQGVPIPPGRHVIELRYDDPTIGYGLAGSAVSIAALLAGAAVARRRRVRAGPARRPRVTESPADARRGERQADPAGASAGFAAGGSGGLLRRSRFGPGGRRGREDAR